jgi:hypothetical protein
MKAAIRPLTRPLTVLAVVATVALLLPLSVDAATNVMVLADRDNANVKAKVSSKGSQWVIENDPFTGQYARVSDNGRRLVGDGNGNLTVDMGNPATPLDTINDITLSAGDTRRPLFSGVGNRKISLTSLIASAEGGTAGSVKLLVIAYVRSNSPTGDCEGLSGFGAAERFTVMVPVGQTVNLNWPSPLVWTQYADGDDYYCVNVESYGGPSGYVAHLSAFGFKN